MYSDSNRLVLSIFRQIESALLLIRDWNAGISDIDDYLHYPNGVQVLSATCMQLQAIGEGSRILINIQKASCCYSVPKFRGSR